jgi:LacI family transcriptional regulator
MGYHRALAEAGLPPDEALVFHREFTQEAGFAMTNEAIALRPRVTALFAVNNFIALGALKALEEAALRVPADVSLVAFDDLPLTLVVNPFLTVAAQPAYEMGQLATQQLMRRISPGSDEGPAHLVLPTTLVVRRSSGPPPS